MPRSRLLPLLAAAVLGVGVATPASAQDQSPYEQCLAAAKGAPASLACAKTEIERQEARLKAAEAKLAGMIDAAAKPLFAAASDAWRKFRDAQCAWDRSGVPKGENAEFAETDCRIGITDARAGELEGRAAPPEDEPQKQ